NTPTIIYRVAVNPVTITVSVTTAAGCTTASAPKIVNTSSSTGGDPNLAGWKNKLPRKWQYSTLNPGDHTYSDANVVPFRAEVDNLCPGAAWSITITYDFKSGTIYAYDYLTTYNATEASVTGNECGADPVPPKNCTSGPNSFP